VVCGSSGVFHLKEQTMTRLIGCLVLFAAAALAGCTGDVQETDDSTRIEADVPKVEIGEGDVDLNPATDDDVDIDTPKPGDE
jgi:hypothetical protein